MSYLKATALMEELALDVSEGRHPGIILAFEPSVEVISLGKNCDPKVEVLSKDKDLAGLGVEVVRSSRGGKATVHGPGQLVIYPVIPIQQVGLGVRGYVESLSCLVTEVLAEFGIKSVYQTENPGIWIGEDKICATGVRIRRRVSMFGIALNVTQIAKAFELIVPCGLSEKGLTYLNKHLSVSSQQTVRSVWNCFLNL